MVQIFSTLPFLFVILFSTTFSPGSGVGIVKQLRYLFPRYAHMCAVKLVTMSRVGSFLTEIVSE
jgi:hypothetical protein